MAVPVVTQEEEATPAEAHHQSPEGVVVTKRVIETVAKIAAGDVGEDTAAVKVIETADAESAAGHQVLQAETDVIEDIGITTEVMKVAAKAIEIEGLKATKSLITKEMTGSGERWMTDAQKILSLDH